MTYTTLSAQQQEQALLSGVEYSWQTVSNYFPMLEMTLEEQRKLGLKYCWDSCGNCFDWSEITPSKTNWFTPVKVSTQKKSKNGFFSKMVKVLTTKLF